MHQYTHFTDEIVKAATGLPGYSGSSPATIPRAASSLKSSILFSLNSSKSFHACNSRSRLSFFLAVSALSRLIRMIS